MNKNSPNILWICTDQQRFDTLGCYGNKFVQTPNLDRLAQMGMLFENCYCQNPVCAPSRASFLTGRYPSTCRVRQNGQNIPEDELLVTKILSDNGYLCGLSGKLHISACGPANYPIMERRIDDGYTVFHWSHHPEKFGCTNNNWIMNEYSNWLYQNDVEYVTSEHKLSKYINDGMDSEHSHTKWCVDKAVDFINTLSTSETPWLFSVNIFDPHHSFNPPEEYLQRYLDMIDEIPTPEYTEGELENKSLFANKDHTGAYDTPGHLEFDAMTEMDHKLVKAAYWAMVDNIDAQVGRLLDSLEETDQLENTIIIFTSDHGELLGDHGIYLKGPHFYECSIHVPLIISWPKKIQGGTKNNQLVELVDIAPTILEAANLDIYEGMQGKSLMTQFENDDTVHKENIYCEYYNSNINHVDPKAYGTMIFDGQYKLIKYHGDKEKIKCIGELYDLESDPNETINRWDDESYKEIKIEMLGKLCDKMAYISDPLPVRKSFW